MVNLTNRVGIDIEECLVMDLGSKATTANAILAGWGKSRRIIFSDTLLERYSWDEIEATLAHEIAHHLHRDVARLAGVSAVVLLAVLYLGNLALRAGVALFSLAGINDVAGLPWLIVVLAALMLVFRPALNWYNRHIEAAADRTALALTGKPEAFIRLMTKLTDQNLIEAEPGRWSKVFFYSHPSYGERIKLARDYLSGVEPEKAA